jgi:hypothetical protein
MFEMKQKISLVSIAAAVSMGLGAAQAGASTVDLPLQGLRNGASILNYFNGGNDSVPTDGTGPTLGFTFSSNAVAESGGTGGSGKFENNPSSYAQILYFGSSSSTSAYMNYAPGFNDLSFNVSYSNNTGATQYAYLYSGLNGSGTLLDTVTINPAATSVTCATRTNAYCTWQSLTTGVFSGTAESVVFSGTAGGAGTTTTTPTTITEFSGLSVAPAAAPVPLPAALWLMVSGVSGLAAFAKRRRSVAAA